MKRSPQNFFVINVEHMECNQQWNDYGIVQWWIKKSSMRAHELSTLHYETRIRFQFWNRGWSVWSLEMNHSTKYCFDRIYVFDFSSVFCFCYMFLLPVSFEFLTLSLVVGEKKFFVYKRRIWRKTVANKIIRFGLITSKMHTHLFWLH